ncbi:hypothetical protein ASU32_19020 [Tsukamurella tyrosinosolvens]|nr:hypothetical protein ASU32_19020 [Tsukamurella tyrosinosolvens]
MQAIGSLDQFAEGFSISGSKSDRIEAGYRHRRSSGETQFNGDVHPGDLEHDPEQGPCLGIYMVQFGYPLCAEKTIPPLLGSDEVGYGELEVVYAVEHSSDLLDFCLSTGVDFGSAL